MEFTFSNLLFVKFSTHCWNITLWEVQQRTAFLLHIWYNDDAVYINNLFIGMFVFIIQEQDNVLVFSAIIKAQSASSKILLVV